VTAVIKQLNEARDALFYKRVVVVYNTCGGCLMSKGSGGSTTTAEGSKKARLRIVNTIFSFNTLFPVAFSKYRNELVGLPLAETVFRLLLQGEEAKASKLKSTFKMTNKKLV
jgi:hypothetical protein